MTEKDEALFDLKVRRVIRKCVVVTLPVWGLVLGIMGWWANGIDSGVKANTTHLTRLGTQLDFVVQHVKSHK